MTEEKMLPGLWFSESFPLSALWNALTTTYEPFIASLCLSHPTSNLAASPMGFIFKLFPEFDCFLPSPPLSSTQWWCYHPACRIIISHRDSVRLPWVYSWPYNLFALECSDPFKTQVRSCYSCVLLQFLPILFWVKAKILTMAYKALHYPLW